MKRYFITLSLCTSALLFADDTQSLQKQLDALKAEVHTLKVANQKKAEDDLDAKFAASSTSASFAQNAYLPDMALILNMSALYRDVNNSAYAGYAVPGFFSNQDEINEGNEPEIPFNKNRGFNLNYAEVAMHSVVDPYFDAFAIFHLHPDAFEIEEAFVRTRALPYGLRVKAGKFRSDFGRINAKHQHAYNFDSQPLIAEALFGADSISDPGVQVQWVAPIDTYVMFGAEAMQGTNERSFNPNSEENSLYIAYAKNSFDMTDNLTIYDGVSFAKGKGLRDENGAKNGAKTENVYLYGADLTLNYQIGSYERILMQSEYIRRDREVSKDKQAGFYTELVYHYNNYYAGGIRYGAITQNSSINGLRAYKNIDTKHLDRTTAMLEYKPFPMSRLRLSYTNDRSKIIAGERKDFNEVMLSLNIAAGAHGAHDF